MERCGQQQRQVERTSHGSQIDQPVDNLHRLASRQPIADDGEEMGVERRVACGEALLPIKSAGEIINEHAITIARS